VEEIVACDGMVDFSFEHGDEAGFAELLVVLRAQDECAVRLAERAK